MVIPFVREALRPLVGSVTSIAYIGFLIGEAGNGALTVAQIIKDPESAPFEIMGLIAGVSAGRKVSKEDALVEASNARMALRFGQVSAEISGIKKR
jgi:chitinase